MRLAAGSRLGLAFTLASAVFLSGLGVTTQLAFEAGASVGTLLSGRFLVAMAILWPLVLILRPARAGRRQILGGFALGVGYSAHAWLFSASLGRLDAGLVDLLLFTYPALVMLAAIGLRRERWSGRRAAALAAATGGISLVMLGGLGTIDPGGATLAFGSALAYAAYVLISARELERTDPFLLTALVTSGAAVTLTVAAAAQGDLSTNGGGAAIALIAVVGLVATAGMGTFIAGISRLGPSRASIVSAVQPALTPLIGFLVFADRLSPEQLLGGALVVAAVVILEGGGPVSGAFAWLPRLERWRLLAAAAAVDIPAGTRLLTQGAAADAFFLIERGRAAVQRGEDAVAELGPGDFFGEVAVLHGGARTASVVALADMRVRVVPERGFAGTMESLPTLSHAVRSAAAQRVVFQPGSA